MGLLHAAGGRGALAGSLGGELLARGLATGGLASGLLRARHVFGLLRARAAYILYINRFNIAVQIKRAVVYKGALRPGYTNFIDCKTKVITRVHSASPAAARTR